MKVRRSLILALLASLTLHAAVMIYGWFLRPQPIIAPSLPTTTDAASDHEPIDPAPDQVRELFAHEERYVRRLTDAQKLAELDRRAGELDRIAGEQLDQLLATVSSALGLTTGQGAHEPNPAAVGPFDPDTASLYDIRKRVAEDGSVRYEHVYVDAGGRTLSHRVTESEMSPQDWNAFGVFESARRNPRLRPLIDLVRRYAQDNNP